METGIKTKTAASSADFLDCMRLIERLHRRILDLLKLRLDSLGYTDVNSVQALLMHNISDREMTAGELRTRGYYLGSNVSYNLKKLVSNGYINQVRSEHDQRSVRISLSDKGKAIHDLVQEMFDKQLEQINADNVMSNTSFGQLSGQLKEIEKFWDLQIGFS
ncbi:winged helix DNA-binding protein [Neptuniibacter sp. CAU 1671]|uniref:MarR family winged helix-turn-helix transcriptional regulator n=1 Tax=Neptuniibacter sp. CAU 1671 TaxID=3032593 RepID=UPI0023DC5E7A|nr:winged helix DNA-binding protein [Neptuniibacter sp. CAU 1671]MDF2183078.1 winged helix DNA-binding protein [Neptuniibacter sp. CAU 1671]